MDLFYKLSGIETAEKLSTNIELGLSEEEAKKRLKKYGPNKISEEKGKSPFSIFISQFQSILIIILIVASIVSFFLGDTVESIAILFVVVLNAILGFVQEYRADQSVKALKELVSPVAKVIRDGKRKEIPQEEVTVGDIVILDSGDKIPADLRIIESARLQIDESILTGESITIDKTDEVIQNEINSIGDMINMAFMGTIVTFGRGKGIVVKIGKDTELGKIASLTQNIELEKTPLEKKLDSFSKRLSLILGIICIAIFALNLKNAGTGLKAIQDTFIFAVSLAVAAIPESLPAVTTIVLSLGIGRMSKRNAVVKRLSSVETLGSTTVICTDKTGTITENKMKVSAIYCDGKEYDIDNGLFQDGTLNKIKEVSYFDNDAIIEGDRQIGDPTEVALLEICNDLDEKFSNIRFNSRIYELPFDSVRKMMSTVNEINGKKYFYTKGAYEEVAKSSNMVLYNEKLIPFSELKSDFDKKVLELSSKGFRVLAAAFKEVNNDYTEDNLTFLGLIAIRDPIRKEVFNAIETCKKAGIRVIMLTGDHIETAKAYARELGLIDNTNMAYSHADLEKMNDLELKEVLKKANVFARINPEDKYRIVTILKDMGEVVAMTGDGVNDAPALRKADIGVAMGKRGTDLAREVSDLVLLDDNFATIVNAIEEGRVIYDNIKKTIFFLLSCNFGEIFLIVGSMILSLKMPLGPLHLLWLNLLTDSFPALALGFEKAEANVMFPRKAKDNDIMNRSFLIGIILQAIFISFGALLIYIRNYSIENYAFAVTMCFAGIVVIELLRALSARSQNEFLLKIGVLSNKNMLLAQCLSFALLLPALYGPLSRILFNSVPLNFQNWIEIIIVSIIVLVLAELRKVFLKIHS
ncbi:MAG TPA: calcium-translocating P-type ATPase, PMCA-type [Caldisericia bacterium]|nr:calcium-translocating P-type ATPase, PMCA-type [Caldisericia bacterium]HQG82100.1 calcium-translocating P-type ATPase, PMCA-type [Caldisericia bacterium]